jgi:hypothetical protein
LSFEKGRVVCLFVLLCNSVGSPAGVSGRRNPGTFRSRATRGVGLVFGLALEQVLVSVCGLFCPDFRLSARIAMAPECWRLLSQCAHRHGARVPELSVLVRASPWRRNTRAFCLSAPIAMAPECRKFPP